MSHRLNVITGGLVILLLTLFCSPSRGVEVEALSIRVGELVFDARASGPTDGQLVILLHGFPQTSFAFRHQLEMLGLAGFRAVAPDQRGYSPRARPTGVESYVMGKLVEDVLGMADALGRSRFHLVGHDWGGAVAWVTALRHPERLISLTVISTPHVRALAESLADPRSDQAGRSAYMQDFADVDSETRFLDHDAARLRSLYEGSGIAADEVQVYIDALANSEALGAALNWYRASALSRGAPTAKAPSPPPPLISVPTLYVWGAEDSAFGRSAAEATAKFVGGPYRFIPLEGVGHWVMEQAPKRLEPLLRGHLEAGSAAEVRDEGSHEPNRFKGKGPRKEAPTRISTLELSQELPSQGRLGGVSVGPDGSIYVANFSATVWKIFPHGEVVRLASSFHGSSGNTLDREGNLLQASFLDGRILRIAPSGETTTLVEGGLDGPVGLAADGEGNVFVCNCRNGSIAKVDAKASVTTLARSEMFECPNGVTFGPDGDLLVVSFGNGHVVRVTQKGEASLFATLPGSGNAHIAYARDSFFITQVASNRVYRLFADGHFEPFAGTGVAGLSDGSLAEATLSRPNGIARSADGSALYLNNLKGAWRGEQETTIVLRRITLDPK